jgi:hypothetical protein
MFVRVVHWEAGSRPTAGRVVGRPTSENGLYVAFDRRCIEPESPLGILETARIGHHETDAVLDRLESVRAHR